MIIPGAGINVENILRVASVTRAREFHSGLSSALPYPRADYAAFERGVRELVDKLRSVCTGELRIFFERRVRAPGYEQQIPHPRCARDSE